MNDSLRILLIVFSIALTIIILKLLSKKKLPVKYSLFWLVAAIVIFLVGAFPNFIGQFTSLIGFQATSNLVTGIIIGLLLLITLLLTIIVSEQKRKIILLVQEVSILKEKIDK
jgi:hypothetical protein